jgi:hypothetical protein
MKSFLLCGIAIASVLMLQPVPASAQRVHGAGHAVMVTRVTALGDSNIIMAAMPAATGPGTALEAAPQPWRRGR